MLINAQRSEELRIAIATGNTLDNYQVEVADYTLTRANIYRGSVASIQPSLNAAFIDYGAPRHGFLAIQDLVEQAYHRQPSGGGRVKIEDVLERGRSIVVQVTKEAEGTKGAALTTSLSLAGRYLVITPFEDTRGVSRKVEDEDVRRSLKDQVAKLEVPAGCGVIVRTNALDQNKTTLSRDISALLRLWKQIDAEARKGKKPKLLYSDQDLVLRALRDYLDSSIEEILVDDDMSFAKAEEYLKAFLPRGKVKLLRYSDRTPLFSRFQLEPQIDRIYQRVVELPSGGSIVIDRTEALTAIDVNSGKATRAASQEETAVLTNLEAAAEVARQLVLRDLGGLIVVDFIDMRASRNQRKVEKALREAMKADKARSSVGRISSNGLLEINRQRIQQALSLRTHRACPTCAGTGRIASPEMVGLALLRRIQERAVTGTLAKVRVALHPELADAFQNSRRRELAEIEEEYELKIEVIASTSLHRPDQEIEWFERDPADVRRRQPKPLEAAVQVSQLVRPVEDDEEEDGEEDGKAEGRGRKRRRKGRKGKGEGPRAAAAEGPAPATTAPAAEAPDGDGEEAAGPAGAKRGRRRRKRGRRAPDGRGETATGSEAPEAARESGAGATDGGEGSGEGSGEGPAEGNGGRANRHRKRRRRGRRRPGEGGGGEGPGGDNSAGDGPGGDSGGEG